MDSRRGIASQAKGTGASFTLSKGGDEELMCYVARWQLCACRDHSDRCWVPVSSSLQQGGGVCCPCFMRPFQSSCSYLLVSKPGPRPFRDQHEKAAASWAQIDSLIEGSCTVGGVSKVAGGGCWSCPSVSMWLVLTCHGAAWRCPCCPSSEGLCYKAQRAGCTSTFPGLCCRDSG